MGEFLGVIAYSNTSSNLAVKDMEYVENLSIASTFQQRIYYRK
jgi:hypothetical protein